MWGKIVIETCRNSNVVRITEIKILRSNKMIWSHHVYNDVYDDKFSDLLEKAWKANALDSIMLVDYFEKAEKKYSSNEGEETSSPYLACLEEMKRQAFKAIMFCEFEEMIEPIIEKKEEEEKEKQKQERLKEKKARAAQKKREKLAEKK